MLIRLLKTTKDKKRWLLWLGVLAGLLCIVVPLVFIVWQLNSLPFINNARNASQNRPPCGPWGQSKNITMNTLPLTATWQFVSKSPIVFVPSVSDGIIFVRSAESECPLSAYSQVTAYALDSRTGKELWETQYTGLLSNIAPIVTKDLVIFPVSAERALRAVDRQSGQVKWEITEEFNGGPIEGIATDGNLLFVSAGGDPNRIVALNSSTGQIVWQQEGPFPSKRFAGLRVYQGKIFAYFFAKGVYVLSPETGQIIQMGSLDFRSYYQPSVLGSLIFLNSDDRIIAFDLNTLQQRWQFSPPCSLDLYGRPTYSQFLYTPSPVVDRVFVANGCKMLFALGAQDGTEKWKYISKEGESISQVGIMGDVGYAMFSDWSIRAISLANGEEIGRIETDSTPKPWTIDTQGVTAVDNILYATFGDHMIYAFSK